MLTLTASDKKQISDLVVRARKRPLTLEEIIAATKGTAPPIGDNPEFVTELRAGKQRYRVVFSVEMQRIGPMRHVSVSSDKNLRLEDVNDILRRFGFKARLFHLNGVSNPPFYEAWLEPIDEKRSALNVLEVIDSD